LNNKFYGKYKNVRNAAWNVLIDFNIKSLPIRVTQIAKKMGIIVLTYSAGNEIIDIWKLRELSMKNDGFTARIEDQWYIFYDENIRPKTRIRFTLAHEVGHFVLGHELKIAPSGCRIGYTEENIIKKRKSPIESEADMFAMRLLAPACVLWGLNITEADDIVNLCGICMREAIERARRMKILYKRGRFMLDNREKRVFEQFKEFIEEEKLNY